jgi:hypothetical protein
MTDAAAEDVAEAAPDHAVILAQENAVEAGDHAPPGVPLALAVGDAQDLGVQEDATVTGAAAIQGGAAVLTLEVEEADHHHTEEDHVQEEGHLADHLAVPLEDLHEGLQGDLQEELLVGLLEEHLEADALLED